MAVCASCAREVSGEFRFCPFCGAAIGGATEQHSTERKVVTCLFCDLVGFTARAERLDPEDVEAILRPYHEHVRSELERLGGTVEKFIGDAVMALFGAPAAHEDDPERAVRAALAIRDSAREEADLQVRIAVNTGEALINLNARPGAGEKTAAGDVVNTTSRMQAAAPVNGVIVGETTYRATRHVIDYRDHRPLEAKGKAEPIVVWEAVEARSRLGVDLLRTVRTQLVGRERECALLREALVRVREESAPQLVTLVGVPGLGKSRLVYELRDFVEHGGVLTYWRQGRSLPYGEGVTYWALSEMVKAQAGILETDSTDDAERKLRASVDALVADAADADWIAAQLRPLAGVGAGDDARGDRQHEAFTAWRRFFEAMAEQRPLVLVFEDVQWADDGLLDFIDHLADWATGVPLLVVCTARPELIERRPGWGGGKLNAATLSLAPLSDEETAQLFVALLEHPLLEAGAQQRLLAHAGGNPLYAEQFAQMYAERGASDDLPESVHGIIAARLDLLSADEKQLLQDASVLGKVFWLGGLVDGRSRVGVERHLHTLERKGFLQRARRTSLADDVEYAFAHLLVRDVAYGQIPRAARAAKHADAAAWIESLGRPEDHGEMLAHHYLRALELSRATGRPTAALEERARTALEHAGDRAFALNAYPGAVRFYEEALALWPAGAAERAHLLFRAGRARYLGGQGGNEQLEEAAEQLAVLGDREAAAEVEATLYELIMRQGHREPAESHLKRAQELLADAPASRSKTLVLTSVTLSHMLASRSDQAVTAGRIAFEMASELGLDEFRSASLNFIGVARVVMGDRTGVDDIEQALAIALAANAPYEVARCYNNLAAVHASHGDLGRSWEAVEACIDVTERFGQAVWRNWQRSFELSRAYTLGDWDLALKICAEILGEGEAQGGYHACGVLALRACIALARDDAGAATVDAERAVELARLAQDPQALYPTLAASAYVAVLAGNITTGTSLVDELLDAFRGGTKSGAALDVLTFVAWALHALGRGHELDAALKDRRDSRWIEAALAFADGELRRSADICAAIGSKVDEAYARLRAAEVLAEEGRRAEADEQLRIALAFYRSVGAKRFVREGEALLAASA
jgi:class 3 adenylate cyclase/tetratricopeptide (TPR) repeat protein